MRRLTLTFDNGPCAGATDRILDILAERRILATFFVVGERLLDPASRRSTERAKREGHWIGNHTMTHSQPLGLSSDPAYIEREIGGTEQLLGMLSGSPLLFRPHGLGSLGPHLLSRFAAQYLAANRYTVVLWNCVPRDWEPPYTHWVEAALQQIAQQSWSVLVLHDRWMGDMLNTLPRFLDEVQRQQIEIVQEFPADCIVMSAGKAKSSLKRYVASDVPMS